MTSMNDTQPGSSPASGAAPDAAGVEALLAQVDTAALGGVDRARAFVSLLLGERFTQRHRGVEPARLSRAVTESYRFLSERPQSAGRAAFDASGATALFPGNGVLRTHTRDVPFLVESLKQLLSELGLEPTLLLHPILAVRRDGNGAVQSIAPASTEPDAALHESLIHVEVQLARDLSKETLESAALEVLAAAHLVSADRDAMRTRMLDLVVHALGSAEAAPPAGPDVLPDEAVIDFLRWLLDENFTFLAARTYEVEGAEGARKARLRPGSGLGLLRDETRSSFAKPAPIDSLDPATRDRILLARRLVLDKTSRPSPIHRRVPMDAVSVRVFENGRFLREERFMGLYTRKALFEQPTAIPILRTKHRRMLDRAGVVEGSFDERELTSLFNALPKEELFLNDPASILSGLRTLLDAYAQDTLKIVLRPTFSGRLLAIGLAIPDRYFSSEGLDQVVRHLEARLATRVLERREARPEQGFRQVYLYAAPRPAEPPEPAQLEAEALAILKPWSERLAELLAPGTDPEWADAFPLAYQNLVPPVRAAADAALLASVTDSRPFAIGAVHPGDPNGGDPSATLLRIAHREPITLGTVMPVLKNLALEVIDEAAFRIAPSTRDACHLHVFRVRGRKGELLDAKVVDVAVIEGLTRVLSGEGEDDPVNGLMTAAGLSWRQVWIVRAYVHHAFQLGLIVSRATAATSLLNGAKLARTLVRWFETRFDPHHGEDERRHADDEIASALAQAIEAIEDPTDYKVFRVMRDMVAASVRTNHYRDATLRSRALAIKIDPRRVPGVPRPAPAHEIFVLAPGMEGVHLRGGDVARGGIRFSDRPDDFRTEVLGLMKTQMVKNAIIVPVGAKGGFILNAPPPDRTALAAAALDAYQTFISALLDVTDNRVGEGVEPPRRVVRLDGDDPYFVVAADKGTASYSDVANGIAARYGFWLGDAFASGGSRGYDHKKLGITARGAWECAKVHFWEMGVDPERQPITVVGIGDMSGDVFGNGLLMSRTIRLIGAFNHRHVFLDPDPDPERSFAERERCFQAALGWDGYDASTISPGGGVFLRRSRAIPVPLSLRMLLGIAAETASGEELIRALLAAPVDLLTNGGIGTYVKASGETHAEVGDKSNDAVRVDATQMRCKVVAEGGNLGLTQAARIELSAAGVRVHTDAIDNSGGVDCSDHEVNVKIALTTARARGEIDLGTENQALVAATDEICEHVLTDNRLQALVLAYDQRRSRVQFEPYQDLIGRLVATGHLDAENEGFSKRDLKTQRGDGHGFFKPQLAVLIAHEKRRIYDALIQGDLIDAPDAADLARAYFPESVTRAAPNAVGAHPLRREIVATGLSNLVVNRCGISFVSEIENETGVPPEQVVGAWRAADAVLGGALVFAHLAALALTPPRVDASAVLGLLARCNAVLARATRWNLLRHRFLRPDEAEASRCRERTVAHLAAVGPTVSAAEAERRAKDDDRLRGLCVPDEALQAVARLEGLADFFVIEALSAETGAPPDRALTAHGEVSALLHLNELHAFLERAPLADAFDRLAARRLDDQIEDARYRIASRVLQRTPAASTSDVVTATSAEARRYFDAVDRLRAIGAPRNLHAAYLATQSLLDLASALPPS